MATESIVQDDVTHSRTVPGQPSAPLEIEESTTTQDEVIYPKGVKLFAAMASMMVTLLVSGLGITIVAVVVPSLTNEFRTIEDIGWYSASFGIFLAAFTFFFGKLYTVFSVKWTFIASVGIFEVGSLLCTVAQNSATFIFGRAISGMGTSGIFAGGMVIIAQCFPNEKRPMWISLAGLCQAVGLVAAPPIGGALTDSLSWRACFGMNLPLGVLAMIMIAWSFEELEVKPERLLPFREKLRRIDLFGTALVVPAIACLLIALQWGGLRYGWGDYRIVLLIAAFVVLFAGFIYLQYRLKDKAVLPLRVLKNRSIIAGAWFSACCDGTMAVTDYFLVIYFQGVRGFSAAKSGLLILPLIIGVTLAAMISGFGTSKLGYYTPFAIATTVLAPVAAGLLTTLDIDESIAKIVCCLAFLGLAIGIGLQVPSFAVNTVLPAKDIPIGISITSFSAGLGTSLFLAASAALFQNRLIVEVNKAAPGLNVTNIGSSGLTDIRMIVGPERLRSVLLGYDEAVTQTLYLPVALTVATLLGTALMEWRSVKTKQS